MSNKTVWESPDIVAAYARLTELQPPELTILDILRDTLGNARMLDIGVGGGRTTLAFAGLVKTYVGIDYSEPMIEACRRKFRGAQGALSFWVGDAMSLSQFGDASFDFVLFSFNGVDYMPHESRLKALSEMKRVARPGGYVCFSSHNLTTLREKPYRS